MKKRLISVSLAVLLAVGLSITVFPAQAVEALEKGGLTFHITAKGEGAYKFSHDTEWQTGEFFINVAGQKGDGYKWNRGRGYGTPQDTVQGHIRGSFGELKMDLTLKNPSGSLQVHLDDGKLEWVTFDIKGTYDGNKVEAVSSRIRLYYDDGELDYIKVELANIPGTPPIYIIMSNASVDLHQNPN